MDAQLQLLEQLIAVTSQPRWHRALVTMLDQLRLPMAEVLDKVPGKTASDKAEAIGIARNTYYEWLRESFRPSRAQAEHLARITGYKTEDIQGHAGGADGDGRKNPTPRRTVAKGSKKVPGGAKRVRAARGRVATKQGSGRSDRAAGQRD